MPCSAGDDLTWPPVKEVVDAIDQMAADLGTLNYDKLIDHDEMPFAFDDKFENITLYQSFTLSEGTTTIYERYIADDAFSASDFSFPDPILEKMAAEKRLIFVHEEDDCLCTTGFRVIKDESSGRYTLSTLETTGCCAALDVPENGDTLPAPGLIPARPFGTYVNNGNPNSDTDEREGEQCREIADGVYYKFIAPEAESPLDYVQTKMEGYFTWEADKCYFETMLMRYLQILRCDGNGGAKDQGGILAQAWMDEGYYIWPAYYHSLMQTKGYIDDEPGCLSDADDPTDRVEYHGMGDADDGGLLIFKAPWRENTCSGEDCDEEAGPKFYCETLKQWKVLAERAKDVFRTISSGAEERSACTCAGGIIYNTDSGAADLCSGLRVGPLFGSSIDPCCIASEGDITCQDVLFNPDDGETYVEESTHSRTGGYFPSGSSGCENNCSGEACNGCRVESNGQPLDYVIDANQSCTETATASLSSCISTADPGGGSVRSKSAGGDSGCWPERCSISRGTFQVVIFARDFEDGEYQNDCYGTEVAPGSVTAKILIYTGSTFGGDYVEVERTVTCTWDTDGWYSEDQDFPDEPYSITQSNNSFYWYASVEEVTPCPKCTPLSTEPVC